MEQGPRVQQAFATPEQELAFLRAQIQEKEKQLRERGEQPMVERVISEQVKTYKEQPVAAVLAPQHAMPTVEKGAIVLNLSPESHDDKIAELLTILQERGLKNALSVVEAMNNPHLEDDFERFVVQYIKAGFPTRVSDKDPLIKALRMTLFEIALPEQTEEAGAQQKPLKEVISSMEQLYSGLLSLFRADEDSANYFTIELAVANHSNEFVFYVAVPDAKRGLLEKQISSLFAGARVTEKQDDYNIFNESGVTVGSVLKQAEHPIWPIKTYEQFDHDPLTILLNSFSKIDKDGEGASIQFVIRPVDTYYTKRYKEALEKIQQGVKVKDALNSPEGFTGHFIDAAKHLVFGSELSNVKKKERTAEARQEDDQKLAPQIELIRAKLASPIIAANVRIIASSHSEDRAREILNDIEASFHQFDNTSGNRFTFKEVEKKALKEMIMQFTFRYFEDGQRLPLNIHELTSLMHLPAHGREIAPQLRTSKAGAAPAPLELPQQGVVLGRNVYRSAETRILMAPEDRLRHFYVIGQTGTGKTTLLKNMIVQDILNGDGVCMIDPHGSDIQDVLSQVPPERHKDVIYFDPAYTDRPMGLNMLEYDPAFPEQKTFVVNELFSIFQKLYGGVPESMGPMFEQYFRNATMLVIEHPESGSTLLDVSRVMSNKAFREMKLQNCKNPIVVQFWREVAEKAGGEASLANIVPYITSKFDVFLANEIMRPIIAQEHSVFNFRKIMDEKKILLVNLSKGRLGDINANLIGLILVGKILMAALSRVDSIGAALPPFYLYIDEFQNITTNSIATILSEARKYKLSLTIAHQFIAQLQDSIKDAVFGNVGSMATFRVGSEDAEFLQKQFAPVFTARDIMNIDNHNAYITMLVHGRPTKPFNIETFPPPPGKPEYLESIKQLSYAAFGRPRAEVEAEIMVKYQKQAPVAAAAPVAPAPQPVMPAAAPMPTAPVHMPAYAPAPAPAPAQNTPFQL